MEKVRKISKRYYVRQIVSCWLVWWMAFGLPLRVAMATPDGGVFQVGTGTIIDGVVGGDNTVVVNQMESVIHWGSPGSGGIDTSSSESLSFSQGVLSNSAVLNRIMSNNTTQFDGALNGVDMRIFIVNPAGVIFGHGASVNVNQLVASGLPMTNDDFLTAVTNPSEKMVFGPGSGDVTIEGTLDADGTGSLYFVGENVFNNGAIICPDGLVVMAAGDEMLLGQPGSDVIVALGDLTADEDNDVINDGTVGGSSVDKLVLAAGDVWSQAISNVKKLKVAATESAYFDDSIYAYSDGGSDAVAEVDIEVDGDFTVDYEIMAEADAPAGFNSSATVNISATGDVIVDDHVKAEADADEEGSGNATATVNITGGSVTVNATDWDYVVEADAWADDGSGNATANLSLSATDGDVDIYDDIRAEADTREGSGNATANLNITADGEDEGGNVYIDTEDNTVIAEAAAEEGSGDATAGIVIDAEGDVEIDDDVEAHANTDGSSGNADASLDIDAGGDVSIYWSHDETVKAQAEASGASGNATATVDIDAGGSVYINDYVKAKAETYDYSGSATANVNIASTGDEEGDGVEIDEDGMVEATANAYDSDAATAGIDIDAVGDVDVFSDVETHAKADDSTGNADSTLSINSTGGDVNINWNEGDTVKAWSEAKFGAGNATSTVDIDAAGSVHINDNVKAKAETKNYSGSATANIYINSTGDGEDDGVLVEEDGMVEATANAYNSDAATAGIAIDAVGDVEIFSDVETHAKADDSSGNADSTLSIIAGGDVNINWSEADTVKAWSEAKFGSGDATSTLNIDADGSVHIDDNVKAKAETYTGSGSATANINISAGDGVDDGVLVDYDAFVEAAANAYDSEAATAGIAINAGGDVEIFSDVETHAKADESSGNATSTLSITSSGGDVNINWSEAETVKAWSEAKKGSGDATSTLNIDADGSVHIDDNVKAKAETKQYSGSATANVNISAGEDVLVEEGAWVEAAANAIDSDAATAGVAIDAGEDVDIFNTVETHAKADNSTGNADASLSITADGDVTVDSTDADAWAETKFGAGNATTTVTVSAANVSVVNDGRIGGDAYANNGSGNSTATVDITTTSSEVLVDNDGSIGSYAYNENGSGDATARTTVNAGDVTVQNGSEIFSEAYAYSGSGDASATVDVDATGDVVVDGGEEESSYIWSYAYSEYDSGDATAQTTVDAANVTATDEGYIYAEAYAYSGSGDATATTEITTTSSEVLVEDDSYIYSYAYSDEAGDATARTTVTADDITVRDESDIYAEAFAYYHSSDATATTEITTTGSEVLVENNSEIYSYAETDNDAGDATATTTVNAGDVIVTDSEMFAEAYTYSGSGDATATVDVDATGVVVVDGGGEGSSYVWTYAAADDSGDATALTTVDAADVTAIDDAEIYADAYADDAGDATATTEITTTNSEVLVDDDSYIYSIADAQHSGDATARTTVIAGDVTVINNGEIYAEAEARYGSGDATATVEITTTSSDVLVENNSSIGAYADTGHGSGDAKAAVAVDTGGVNVRENSEIRAEAKTEHGSGDAEADVQIAAYGDVLVENDSEIVAWAETYHYGSGDATATVGIDAGGDVTVIGHEPDGDGTSKIMAHAMTERPKYEDSSGDATADVDIDVDGDFTATRDGKVAAVAVVLSGGESHQLGGEVSPSEHHDPGITMLEAANATADVTINADGDVTVEKGSEVKAKAYIESVDTLNIGSLGNGEHILLLPGDATASVDIDAGGDVTVEKGGEVSAEAGIHNEVEDVFFDIFVGENGEDGLPGTGDATATVDIVAGGDVTADRGGEIGAYAWIDNYAYFWEHPLFLLSEFPSLPDLGDATANLYVDAGGDVTVSRGGDLYADAELYNRVDLEFWGEPEPTGIGSLEFELPGLGDATAGIEITTPGSLTVDKGGEVYAEASIEYEVVESGFPLGGFVSVQPEIPADEETGDATASVVIDAYGDVYVGEHSEIVADAWIESSYEFGFPLVSQIPEFYAPTGDASASVDILATCGDVIVDGLVGAYADIYTELLLGNIEPSENGNGYSGDTSADILIRAGGDVVVNSGIEDEVVVDEFEVEEGPMGGQIEAVAHGGYDNSADITILAVGDVIVNDGGNGSNHISEIDSSGPFIDSPEEILAKAYNGYTNNAHIGIATRPGFGGDVIVDGQIGARTSQAYGLGSENNSDVEICAARDVIVNGGYAEYELIADGELEVLNGPVYSEEGGQIMAGAADGFLNTANVEIYAGRDVIVHGAEVEYVEIGVGSIGTQVQQGNGYYDGGQILTIAKNGYENTANIGISAQRDVTVEGPTIIGEPPFNSFELLVENGDGYGLVQAKAKNGEENTATVDICALDDVTIDGIVEAIAQGEDSMAEIVISAGDEIAGTGEITADADDPENASLTFYVTDMDHFNFDGIMLPEEPEFVFDPLDCPACDFEWIDWEWCEDCEEEVIPPIDPAPITTFVPPFDQPVEFGPGGCPLLMMWLADELGVGVDIQVVVANAYAYSTDCQPCDAAARLQEAARILADEDGAHLAAMLAVFSELAPTDAPFTPEMGTAIATAFSGAAEGSQYASAAEYVDAFVQYIAILDTELGSPVEDSVAFVMGTYGTGITEGENNNLAAFVATRMEAGETFAP